MSKSKKLCSGRKKAGAVIYLDSDSDIGGRACEKRLNEQEARCRKYCAGENFEVLGVFRDRCWSYRNASKFNKMLLPLIYGRDFWELHHSATMFSIEHEANFLVTDNGAEMRVLKLTRKDGVYASVARAR